MGSIFRTADSAGLARIYLTGYSPTPEHRGVRKTALGADLSVPWSHHPDPRGLVDQLRRETCRIVALERTENATGLEDVKAEDFPMVLIVGNEVSGVPPEMIAAADFVLGLPQYGVKASLNVSVAFGIAAYGLVGRFRAG